MPRLKPIAVFITMLITITAAIAAGLAALPSHGAGAEGGNEPIVTNVNISPALNITRFDFYTLSVNVDPNGSTVNNVSFVIRPQTASVSNSNWDFFTNGSPNPNPNVPFTRAANESPAGTWSFDGLRPDNIYPEIAFIRGISSAPSNSRFWRDSYHLMNFTNHFNMSANTSFFIEIYATPKTSPPLSVDMQVFLVGKGFDISAFEVGGVFANEAWRNHADVELVGTISQDSDFHHTHSPNSSHFLIPLSTNSEGKIEIGSKTIDISGDFWVILTTGHQLQNRGWDLKYHDGENNGTWYKGAGTDFVLQSGRPDAHVHFARESLETYNGMEVHVEVGYNGSFIFESDPELFYFIELPNLPPNPSAFTAPAPGIYRGDVTISWLPAADANNDPITYNVSLIGDAGEIPIESGLTDTSYSLNTSAYPDGFYDIRVEACESGTDDLFCTSFNLSSNLDEGLCEFFRIWNGDPEDGAIGTTGNPYLICDVCDLQNMKLNLSAHYALNNSIDLTGFVWANWSDGNGFIPVGDDSTPFTGSFDGRGYNISGLFIDRPSTDNVGLFGDIDIGAEVRNISLIDVDISGNVSVGGLSGANHGTILNLCARGNVTGNNTVGGLVGYNEGTVNRSYAAGGVSGTVNGNDVGGLAGYNNGSVSDSYAMGNVSGKDYIGGLVGGNYGNVSNSYSMGNVSGSYVGGLVGVNSGNVSNSFYDQTTSGRSDNDGRGVPKTTSEMKTFSTFYNAGWDIERNSEHNINDGYPYLSWQIPGNSPVWYIYSTSVTLNTSSTAGGSVTDPGEGSPVGTYNYSQVVTITATNESCYHFVNWSGDTGTIANASAASTTITMNGSYTIQANFAYQAYSSGSGTAGDPYLICDVCDLQAMNLNLSAHYALNNSINASATSAWNSGNGFRPVGIETAAFEGGFDGRGFNISGLFINRGGMDNVGLFGYVNSSGSIGNVSLTNANVTGSYGVGTLVGNNEGTVTNSSAAGHVNGDQTLGGLVGRSMGWYGGLIADCHAAIDVSGSWCNIGGLVGWNDGPVSNSSATGDVSGDCNVGGLVGGNANANVISCSYATGAVSGTGDSIGGLLGYNENGTVANSYAMGNVSGASYVGGLVGKNNNYINSSYSTGYVSGSGSDIGGLVGYNGSGPVANSFWDTETSNMSTSNGGTGKTTAEMKTLETFTGAGWDIEENATTNINNGYPYLSWQIPGNSPVWYMYTGPFTFTLNYSAGAGGSLTGNTSQIVAYGGSGTAVTAVPDPCYHFVSWNDSSPDNPRTDTNVTGNITVIANFAAGYAYANGSGTIGDPWLITNVDELQAMKCNVSAHYALNNSIDASNTSTWNSGAGFIPVGNGSGAFTGTFDGRGYTITGLFINRSTEQHVGLFGYINTDFAIASNVSLAGVNITGGNLVGSLAGINYGTVHNCSAAGTVSGDYQAIAGLVGYNWGTVSNSSAAVNVIGTDPNCVQIGGLVGYNEQGMSISNSSATGTVNGNDTVGGLAGYNNGSISDSFATGGVSGHDYVGGLIGKNYLGTVSGSHATGDVSGDERIGGLAGESDGVISNSQASGNVSGMVQYIGGLVGYNYEAAISDSDATGSASGPTDSYSYCGGLVGYDVRGTISNSSAAGSVSGGTMGGGLIAYTTGGDVSGSSATGNVSGDGYVGGLIGYTDTGSTVSDSHAAGRVNASDSSAGGLVGGSQNSAFVNTYATGNVSGTSYVGGLVGYNENTTVSVSYATGNVSLTASCGGGLIGYSHTGSSVSNSSATGNVSGVNTLGGLIGQNLNSAVSDSYAIGAVNGSQASVGGLIGENYDGTVFNCSASGNVNTGNITWNSMAGGLAGVNTGTISSCSAIGNVSATGDYVGGLIGDNRIGGSVSNSSAAGGVSGREYVGGLAGYSNSSVSNSSASGAVSGNAFVGGLVGHSEEGGSVAGCWAAGNVSGTNDVGGLLGHSNGGTVNNSHAAGNVSGSNLFAGGLIGQNNEGTVNNSYATGNVSVGHAYAGGLMGYSNAGAVANSYATGDVTSPLNLGDYLGGLVGNCDDGSIMSSYAAGNVGGDEFVGGLVGRTNLSDISNSYAMGNVTGQVCTGGLIGQNYFGTVNKSYAAGGVSWWGAPNWIGGLVGATSGDPDLLVTNSFWDTETSGLGASVGGGTGKNTSEMKSFSTFFSASWDIEKNHVHNINDGYPYLSWQIPGNSPVWYIYDTSVTLNISSTGGGSVITPGEGDHFYNVSDVVNINASPDHCYRFVNWTGTGAIDIANTSASSTTITMNDSYSITANFAPDSAFAGGDGSEGNPYLIQNVCALQNMSANLSAHYALANDIDAANTSTWNGGAGFIPVGNGSTPFTGSLNGSGHTITGLLINRAATTYVGLFGYTNGSALSDVSLVNISITGGSYVGGLVGYSASGNVSGSSAAGNVRGFTYVGGLAGSLYQGTVNGSYATGDISSSIGGPQLFYAGGLVGVSNGSTVDNSYATGNFSGSDYLGGLVGHNYQGTVNNSYAAGTVTGDEYVGGLVGNNSTTSNVNNSYATGNVSGGSHVGGLVGYNENFSTVNNSHAIGNVIGGTYVGGLIGYNYIASSAYNSYATGDVSGTANFIGGLIGENYIGCVVNQSYATGEVTGGASSSYIGGLVGQNRHSSVDNSYATGDVSGTANFIGGLVGSNSPGAINNSYAIGNVSGDITVGGLAGSTSGGSVNRSYSKGFVSGSDNLGGLIGFNENCSVSDSFWDTETSGMGTSSGGTGVNTSEMKDFFTFYDAEWDLICESDNGTDDIWGLDYSGAGNNGYPFLWWQGLTHNVSFTLNMSSSDGGNVSTPDEGMQGPYNCSESVSIIADPDVGYFFVDWTGNTSTVDDVNDESTTVTMFGDYSITANFTNVMYNLSIASTPGGNVTAPGEGIFPYGSGHVVAINASADPCYYFVNWTGDMGGNISDVNNPNTSITMNGNYSITANFAKIQYTLNTSSTVGGNVSPPGEGTYNCSEIVDIEATADDCYYFVNWTGTGAVAIANTSAASTTINMSANYSITANFAIYQYTLNTSSSIGGNVSDPGEGTPIGTYNCSEALNISATADDCYHFVNWTGTGAVAIANTSAASTTINMSANYSIQANFAMTTYDLSIDSTAGGSVTDPGEGTPYDTYNCSEVIDLVATPADDCHYFVNWTGDTATIANTSAASTSITINGSYSITANFAVYEFDLTTSSSAGGNVSTPGEGTYTYNCSEAINIVAQADDCYHFVNWTGTGVDASKVDDPLSASTFITMDADYDVYANFEIITYTLTYTAGTGGTVTGNTSQTVDCGTNGSEVTAVPNTGFAFLSWSDSSIKNPRTDTNVAGNITVTAGFRYLGGGGGGGGYIPPYGTTTITLNLFDDSSIWAIDTNGVLQEDVDTTSPDGKVSIHIPTGTKALDEDGNPLTEINVDPIDYCPGPPDGKTVIIAFDFHPDGATFDPAIEITITYDPDALPEDVDESQIVIAFYNEATGAWEYLSGTVNPDTNTITFSATHFTIFAVMAPGECAPAPTETPTPTPEPTVEPTPTATVAPTPTPTIVPTPAPADGGDDGLDKWILALIIAVGGALIALLIGAIVMRLRKR